MDVERHPRAPTTFRDLDVASVLAESITMISVGPSYTTAGRKVAACSFFTGTKTETGTLASGAFREVSNFNSRI